MPPTVKAFMVVRLLIVVLTLVGAIPVRICTCGAHHDIFFGAQPASVPTPDLPTATEDPAPAEHHDDDCHFVKPRPLMPPGLELDCVDAPPLDAIGVALPELPLLVPAVGELTRDFHPPPNRPLFLTLLVLRN